MTPPLIALVEALRPIRLAVDRLQWMERGCACIVNLDDLREAAAALSAFEAEPQGWRDIATAPKDGTEVLATNGKRIWLTQWYKDEYAKKPQPFWMNFTQGKALSRPHPPTHWQPLPLPPEPAT